MLTCSDLNERHELGQQGHEHNFKRFLKKNLLTSSLYVCYSGSETGDVGGGAEEADEPSEQYGGEDRQVSSVPSWLNLTFFYSSN